MGTPMKAKLTAKCVNGLKAGTQMYKVWDTEIKGYFVRVSPKGRKTYALFYRANGVANEYTLGINGNLTADEARGMAKGKAADTAKNIDIQQEKRLASQRAKSSKHSTLGKFVTEKYKPWVESNQKSHKESLRTLNVDFEHLHSRKMHEISPWDVQKWMSNAKKRGLEATTINRRVATLKSILSKAAEWKVIDSNPLAGRRRLKTDNKGRVRYLDNSEEEALRATLDNRQECQRADRLTHISWREHRHLTPPTELNTLFTDYLKPIVLLAINTGMRRGELFSLTRADINLGERLLTIVGKTAKSGHTRYIPLNDEAFAVLVSWRNQSNSKSWVFPSPATGERMDNITSSWKNLITDSRIIDFRFHDLRHHFASKLVMAKVDINTVRELLGHKDIQTTLRYAHLAPKHKAAAVALLNT